MSREKEFWKLISNYLIYMLSFIALFLITAPIKYYVIKPANPAVFARIGFIIIFGTVLGYFSNLKLAESREVISPERLNRWIFMTLFYIGVFFVFIFIS